MGEAQRTSTMAEEGPTEATRWTSLFRQWPERGMDRMKNEIYIIYRIYLYSWPNFVFIFPFLKEDSYALQAWIYLKKSKKTQSNIAQYDYY